MVATRHQLLRTPGLSHLGMLAVEVAGHPLDQPGQVLSIHCQNVSPLGLRAGCAARPFIENSRCNSFVCEKLLHAVLPRKGSVRDGPQEGKGLLGHVVNCNVELWASVSIIIQGASPSLTTLHTPMGPLSSEDWVLLQLHFGLWSRPGPAHSHCSKPAGWKTFHVPSQCTDGWLNDNSMKMYFNKIDKQKVCLQFFPTVLPQAVKQTHLPNQIETVWPAAHTRAAKCYAWPASSPIQI